MLSHTTYKAEKAAERREIILNSLIGSAAALVSIPFVWAVVALCKALASLVS